ncbi:Alpha/Beta hydrolase protein [Staphylotrichum tortipilum]|uniref:Alpha/Beta hydrolase protein n=1 Tax=Staphylotrichum tortipilum TaxID=2831512 RepID=A0AAN6RP14_9PEZI|nr:Alpha/Beta hydrolase protein [Staphylotrichum longicolle]
MRRLRHKLGQRPKKRRPELNPLQETGPVPSPSNSQSHTDTDSGSSKNPPFSFPDGVKVLHDCPDATVDICFVHGLTGDRESTWTAEGQSIPWPKSLLPPRLSRARILTYGYDAYVVRVSVASANRLNDHAMNLLTKLTTNRELHNASSRPLIFVAHSLGGLVCKEAILLSRNNPELHLCRMFECIKGVIFMGTPHKGTWMANWAKIQASAIGLVKSTNKSLLEVLETNNQYLESIQSRFMAMLREQREGGRPLGVTCFLEELPLPVAGQVVCKASAILEGFTFVTIHANHRDMVRFASTEEDGFQMLLGELIRWEAQLGK